MYWPDYQKPCPTCHRCPTCGSYRPAPYTWPNTWTSSSTITLGSGPVEHAAAGATLTTDNPNATATATTVPSSFIASRHANEQMMSQMVFGQASAINCAEDCSHDD